jgi:peptide/nickel transport system substrate-binding protein
MATRWRKVLGVTLLATLVGVAAACGDDGGGAAPTTTAGEDGGGGSGRESVAIGFVLAPATLDITEGSGAAIPQALLYNVYETLVKIDDEANIQPLLAKEWDITDDGLTYTFTLNEDVTFHNGDELTAEDVKFSFDRNATNEKAPGLVKATFAPVESVDAPDATTVVVTLTEPSRNFLFNIAQTGGVVVNEASVPELATKPNGSGPYQFKEYVTESSLSLTRYDGYWGEAPAIRDVTFKYYDDPTALANSIKSGEIDIIDNLTPELFQQFRDDPDNFEVVEGQTNGETIIAYNNSRPPLDDVRVRQALTYAVDKEAVVAGAEGGLAKIIGSHASTNDPWFLDLSDTYPHDPEKAQELLADANAENLNLTMHVPPTPYAKSVSQIVQSQLQKVGVNVTLKDVEFPLWLDEVFTNANYDLTVISHVEARDVNQYGNPQYYWRYDDPETQRLLKEAEATTDEQASDELYQQVLRRINEQAVNNWLYLLPRLQVVRKGITGYPTASTSLSYDVTNLA